MTKKLRITGAIVLIAVSWSVLFVTLFRDPPFPDAAIHAAIGKALAQQAAALGQSGALALVLRPDTTEFPRPAFALQFKALEKELRRAGMQMESRSFEIDPLRPNEVPPGDFFEILRKAPPKTVIVSLLGPPLISPEQRKQLGSVPARVVAFCSGSLVARVDLQKLFGDGLLHAAVIEKYPSPAGATRTFEQLYSILTAATPNSAGSERSGR